LVSDFIENRDYYLEKGKIILTEHYLINRGFCCGSGCKFCPYSPPHLKNNKTLKKKK